MYKVYPLTDHWGGDTTHVFSAADAMRFVTTTWKDPTGVERTLKVTGRYVEDVSPMELEALITAGCYVVFYMHVPYPTWTATGANGNLKGLAGAQKLQRLIGNLPASLLIDMEGVGDPGLPADAYVRQCCTPIRASGFLPSMYEGYDDGFDLNTRVKLATDPNVIECFDSDFGQRTPPPGVGFAGKQYVQIFVNGYNLDPHHYMADQRGKTLFAVGLDDGSPLTKIDPPDTKPELPSSVS